MTVWLLHLPLSPADEAQLRERTALPLPLGDAPDLTGLTSLSGCRQRLHTLHPDEPPEALRRRTERLWTLYAGVQKDDIIAVPLPARRQLALAEVTGPYRHEPDAPADRRHLIPVTWQKKPLRITARFRDDCAPSGPAMAEVEDSALRIAIRDTLPRPYNRFARWKWLMALTFALGALQFVAGLIR